ncbi:MAG: alanine racemase [Lachnospiraceae bacterium]|nr:alanine racemase [Lachnospiraceae bacterium]
MWVQTKDQINECIDTYKRGVAYVDLDAIISNMDAMHSLLKQGTQMYAVIKTNGYGHGSIPIAKALESVSYVRGYAVATAEEALELRKEGIRKDILILSYTFPYSYKELIKDDIRITVFRKDTLVELSAAAASVGKNAVIHIAVDTGMGRIGVSPDKEGLDFVRHAIDAPNIKVEGIFTHMAKADETDKTYAEKQLSVFKEFIGEISSKLGTVIPVAHISNSASILELPDTYLDAVRAGITMYGLAPSDEVDMSRINLKPALSLFSHITYVKKVKPGTSISYGGLFTADREMLVATVPLGYGDGYPRLLTGKGEVLVRGKRCPILGRICMDQFMIDVSAFSDIKEGETVTLLGFDGDEHISAEELGAKSGRFNYELVCLIGSRVPRVYTLHGTPVLALSST